MSLQEEFIPEIEMPLTDTLNEQAVLAFDMTALKAQLNVTISSVAWSVENGAVLSLGVGGNVGDVFTIPVTADEIGCSHLIANVTTSDSDQNPTLLFIKINVIQPACGSI